MTRRPPGVRIIGGALRGRRIPLTANAALRPTPDRIRETLFNWLAPILPESRCLDLFAGSGALGIEALSRGAAHTTFVEQNPESARALRALVTQLGLAAAVHEREALAFLQDQKAHRYDIVFLDPPFDSALLAPALAAIAQRDIVPDRGFLYIETRRDAPCTLPQGFRWHRHSRAGQVAFGLAIHEEQVL